MVMRSDGYYSFVNFYRYLHTGAYLCADAPEFKCPDDNNTVEIIVKHLYTKYVYPRVPALYLTFPAACSVEREAEKGMQPVLTKGHK